MRLDQRNPDQLRPIKITPNVSQHAEGSVLVEFGLTRVLCTATVDPLVPRWLAGTSQGWVTAEYGMLPRSTHSRIHRDKAMNSGRTQEISRLIGRSLRACVDLKALGERQIIVDCDVLQADGGTRTAAVTGGFVALALAIKSLLEKGQLSQLPLSHYIAAVSVGLQADGSAILDLNYQEDSSIDTDMNFVMTNDGGLVELQGTAEKQAFNRAQLNSMLDLAEKGCRELFRVQSEFVGSILPLKA